LRPRPYCTGVFLAPGAGPPTVQIDPEDSRRDLGTPEAFWPILTAEELLSLDNQTLLHRLFIRKICGLFDPALVRFEFAVARQKRFGQCVGQSGA